MGFEPQRRGASSFKARRINHSATEAPLSIDTIIKDISTHTFLVILAVTSTTYYYISLMLEFRNYKHFPTVTKLILIQSYSIMCVHLNKIGTRKVSVFVAYDKFSYIHLSPRSQLLGLYSNQIGLNRIQTDQSESISFVMFSRLSETLWSWTLKFIRYEQTRSNI